MTLPAWPVGEITLREAGPRDSEFAYRAIIGAAPC